jgi:hypothetical protein
MMAKNRKTGEQTEVKINDRGLYADSWRRIIDLSRAAMESIGIVEEGGRLVPLAKCLPGPAVCFGLMLHEGLVIEYGPASRSWAA